MRAAHDLLAIYVIADETLLTICARHELYTNVVEGNMHFARETMLGFMRTRLNPWWQAPLAEPGPKSVAPAPPAADSSDHTLDTMGLPRDGHRTSQPLLLRWVSRELQRRAEPQTAQPNVASVVIVGADQSHPTSNVLMQGLGVFGGLTNGIWIQYANGVTVDRCVVHESGTHVGGQGVTFNPYGGVHTLKLDHVLASVAGQNVLCSDTYYPSAINSAFLGSVLGRNVVLAHGCVQHASFANCTFASGRGVGTIGMDSSDIPGISSPLDITSRNNIIYRSEQFYADYTSKHYGPFGLNFDYNLCWSGATANNLVGGTYVAGSPGTFVNFTDPQQVQSSTNNPAAGQESHSSLGNSNGPNWTNAMNNPYKGYPYFGLP